MKKNDKRQALFGFCFLLLTTPSYANPADCATSGAGGQKCETGKKTAVCTDMQRAMAEHVAEAIKAGDKERATNGVNLFESKCAGKHPDYAKSAQEHKKRISGMNEGPVALSRRGRSTGTEAFKQAISQAEQDERERAEKARVGSNQTLATMASEPQPKPVPAMLANKHGGGGSNGQPVARRGRVLTGNECLRERSLLVNSYYRPSDETAKEEFEFLKDMPGNPANFGDLKFRRHSCVPTPGYGDRWRNPEGVVVDMTDCYRRNYRICLAEARWAQIQAEKESPGELGPVNDPDGEDPADNACLNSLKSIERQFDREKQKMPKDSVVVLSEATMWMIAQSVEQINKQCPKSRRYAAEAQSLQKTYQDTKRACDASASSPPCKPRLPGKQPVPAPQVSSKPLPPLKGNSEEQCGNPPSTNAVKCLERKCAKQDGSLTLDKKGCAHCTTKNIGNYWFICPDGVGGAR